MSGSLTHSPSQVIRQLLVDLGHGTLPSAAGSWPIGVAEDADSPPSAIWVRGTESRLHGRRMSDGQYYERYGFQVLVRDTRYEDGQTKARAIAIAMDTNVRQAAVTISSSTYIVHVISRSGGVLDLGKERSTSRHLFSINALAAIEQAA